jgi:hypothetical protein
MNQQQEYQYLVRRLADICTTTPDKMGRDLAREAATAHVRPLILARQKLHNLKKWSVQRIVNECCKDGGPLRHLPHDSVRILARAMRTTARKGGKTLDTYAKACVKANQERTDHCLI